MSSRIRPSAEWSALAANGSVGSIYELGANILDTNSSAVYVEEYGEIHNISTCEDVEEYDQHHRSKEHIEGKPIRKMAVGETPLGGGNTASHFLSYMGVNESAGWGTQHALSFEIRGGQLAENTVGSVEDAQTGCVTVQMLGRDCPRSTSTRLPGTSRKQTGEELSPFSGNAADSEEGLHLCDEVESPEPIDSRIRSRLSSAS
ncbi:hypothetical protein C8R45DRAFT_1193441 [Mycena sanguinolenta]|nr:hypothetical protein C8R45DRAFT_1193441 [Mycena sanguinolenta]